MRIPTIDVQAEWPAGLSFRARQRAGGEGPPPRSPHLSSSFLLLVPSHPSGFLIPPRRLSAEAASWHEHLCIYLIVLVVALVSVVAVFLTKSFCDSHVRNKYNYHQRPSKRTDTNNNRQQAWLRETPRSRHLWFDATRRVTWILCTCAIATPPRRMT